MKVEVSNNMLHTQLVKMSGPSGPGAATDDGTIIHYPRAELSPTTLFCKPPTPESPDPFDDYFSPSPTHQMRSFLTETGNCEPCFSYAVDRMSFHHLFKLFAKFGDSNRSGDAMSLTNSDKWFRQAKVIDNRRISTSDTGIYFKQIAKSKKSLDIKEYEQYLDLITKKKNVKPDEIKYKLASCGVPKTTKTTHAFSPLWSQEVDNGNAIRRLTDHRRYTGTHKLRFDQMGKGRGREGRDDFFENSGYVYGYKSQGTYSRIH